MATFTTYRAVAPVPEQTLASLAAWQGFPTELVTLWREWGTGFIGEDGYVRIIDPAKYQPYLSDWFTDTQGAIPFLATGMGDLLVWQPDGTPGGVIRHVLYRVGDIRNIAPQFETCSPSLKTPSTSTPGYNAATTRPVSHGSDNPNSTKRSSTPPSFPSEEHHTPTTSTAETSPSPSASSPR